MARRTTLRRRHLPHQRRLHPHRQTTHVDRIDNQPHQPVTCIAVATGDADTPPPDRRHTTTPPSPPVESPDKQMAGSRPPSRDPAICIPPHNSSAGCAVGSQAPSGVISLSALSSCRYVCMSCRCVSTCRTYVYRLCRSSRCVQAVRRRERSRCRRAAASRAG